MVDLLKKRWWKYIAIALLLFSTTAGLLAPLSPGVLEVSPEAAVPGEVLELKIIGYNTNFQEAESSLQVVLKGDTNIICTDRIEVQSHKQLTAVINLPANLYQLGSRDYYNVIINNELDGTFFLREGLVIEGIDSLIGKGEVEKCGLNFGREAAKGFTFPYREILYETIRNLYFHVPMWFSMTLILLFSFICSIKFLGNNNRTYDLLAVESARVALLFGVLGLATGMIWAKYTWGAFWVNDPRLNGAAVGVLIYLAYFVLRGSLNDEQQRAKVSAVYSVFAFVIFIVFIFVLPRLTASLHPGAGGNPAFSQYDMDNMMRPVFYSAVIGFTMLGFWIISLGVRYRLLVDKFNSVND